jgi:hypothetical protein
MDRIAGMYEIGQYVYTTREVRGWFDYSVKNAVPANKMGRVVGYARIGKEVNSVVYEVSFDREFGHVNVKHPDLKLG